MSSSVTTVTTPEALFPLLDAWRQEGQTIGFVPTMGALHAGHMALIDMAREHCDRVIASIFVNPKQFGQGEDLERYPRPLKEDQTLLAEHGCDLLYHPAVDSIYPTGFATTITIDASLTDVLCGAHRPGHFNGVATVVTILLNTIRPNMSFFGQKDYQQLLIIRRIHRDLNLSGKVIGLPTIREEDGVALSSRNRYLSSKERKIALELPGTLENIFRKAGQFPLTSLLTEGKATLLKAGFDSVDYLEVRHAETLELLEEDITNGRLFVAARIGDTRLIDNIALN